MPEQSKNLSWRAHLHEVIFEADTRSGKVFDVTLLVAILLSVAVVVLDSVAGIHARYGTVLRIAEWLFTILFTVEYVLRLISVRRPLRYATSFLGIVDLLAIVPTYASLFVTGAQSLLVIRALRLLRIFRIFKAVRFVGEMGALTRAIKSSGPKIVVFLFAVLTAVLIMGTLMYVVEGEDNGFTSIPVAMYWAVVTVTTVGYGDITPKTVPGQMVAAVAMILGYSLIIIPTAIFSMELVQASRNVVTTQNCPSCSHEGHDADAEYCKFCGAQL